MPSSGQEYFWRRNGLAYVPDVTQQRNIRGKPGELNLSTLTYLIPFQGEQKSSKQSRRIIEVARDSLLKTKSCFPGRLRTLSRFKSNAIKTNVSIANSKCVHNFNCAINRQHFRAPSLEILFNLNFKIEKSFNIFLFRDIRLIMTRSTKCKWNQPGKN